MSFSEQIMITFAIICRLDYNLNISNKPPQGSIAIIVRINDIFNGRCYINR